MSMSSCRDHSVSAETGSSLIIRLLRPELGKAWSTDSVLAGDSRRLRRASSDQSSSRVSPEALPNHPTAYTWPQSGNLLFSGHGRNETVSLSVA